MTKTYKSAEKSRSMGITEDYLVDNPIQVKFMSNPKFCSTLKKYFEKTFAVLIVIKQPDDDEEENTYTIQISGEFAERVQSCRNELDNMFRSIQKEIVCANDKIQSFLAYHRCAVDIIQNILNHKKEFVVIELKNIKTCVIHYFKYKMPFYMHNINETIKNNALEVTLILPFHSEQTIKCSEDFQQKIQENNLAEDMISIRLIDMLDDHVPKFIKQKRRQQLRIFGYHKTVREFEQQYKEWFNRYQLNTFSLQLNPMQMDYLTHVCSASVREIERRYHSDGVSLQIKSNEFIAPLYVTEEVVTQINDLFSNMKTVKFQTAEIFQAIAEREIERLQCIAHRNQCHIHQHEFATDNSRAYIVPKAIDSNTIEKASSKFLLAQSNLFGLSTDVIRKVQLSKGSISVCIGDIAKEKADVIVVPSTSNGLCERIIEQAGLNVNTLTYQPNQQKSNIKFIEAQSKQLLCKSILFSNWTPPITSDDNTFRRSAQGFIAKSIQYAITQLNAESVAFALPDLYDKEDTITNAIVEETKRQLERSSTVDVSFVFFYDQKELFDMFATEMEKLHSFLEFSFPTITMQITLLSSSRKSLKKCQNKIESYLKRLMTKSKLEFKNDDRAFKQWNQHLINAYYFYCKERCVLSIILDNSNRQVIELCGPPERIQEVRDKYRLLDTLQKQKLQIQTTLRLNSSTPRAAMNITCYNIMLVHNPNDQARCQRLADRLIDDGFSALMIDTATTMIPIDKCDCIIICLSHRSQENEEAIANAVNGADAKVILTNIQYFNTSVSGWLHEYMIGKLCYYLYGSDSYFNLEYDKLMLEVLKITKPGYISLLQSTVNTSDELQQVRQQTEQQRKHLYNKRVKKLMKLGKIDGDDMKKCIEKVKDILKEPETDRDEMEDESMVDEENETNQEIPHVESSLLLFHRWLNKAPNVSKQNIPPFTLTGDINDAIFPLPEDMNKNKEEFMQRYFTKYRPFGMIGSLTFSMSGHPRTTSSPYGNIPVKQLYLADRTFGIPSTEISQENEQLTSERIFGIPSTEISQENEQLISERRNFFSAHAVGRNVWENFPLSRSIAMSEKGRISNRCKFFPPKAFGRNVWANYPLLSPSVMSEQKIEKRKQLDGDLSIMQEFRDMKTQEYVNKYPEKEKQILDIFQKDAPIPVPTNSIPILDLELVWNWLELELELVGIGLELKLKLIGIDWNWNWSALAEITLELV
ncbi:unnamed protein product [Rotaria socialis]|uniref:Macro domain-containing protein n=1 Tax=Rotaria socialis TaxID=392032 RepID=A0A820KPJ0_9BILA|nr:unnamed protein product [Rotaria socialis]CAF4345854.1 unnamed protein product [Rotaria socialis]